MTDRELLELAAKAAGIVADYFEEDGDDSEGMWGSGYEAWNPLTNDGDALRLAVDLGIEFFPAHNGGQVVVARCYRNGDFCYDKEERPNGDDYAATRRAIVRVAAEIGKQMENKK